MVSYLTRYSAPLPFALVLSCIGCSSGEPLQLAAVSGTVTLNQKPVAGMAVTFTPLDESGLLATGLTDAQGRYVASSAYEDEPREGVKPGKYKVIFSELRKADGSPLGAGDLTNPEVFTGGIGPSMSADQQLKMPPTETVEVPEGGKSLDFELAKLGPGQMGDRKKIPRGFLAP